MNNKGLQLAYMFVAGLAIGIGGYRIVDVYRTKVKVQKFLENKDEKIK